MTVTQAVRTGGIVAFVLFVMLAVFLGGNQRQAYAEPLGSDIVCRVFNTLTGLGDPIPVLTTGDCTNPPEAPAQCADEIDNDGDGLVDSADPGCLDGSDNNESNTSLLIPSACVDGVDNDGDGLIDFVPVLGDPGCSDIFDTSEENDLPPPLPPSSPACSDGIDNDGDELVDLADPGCSSSADTDETNPSSENTAKLVVVKVVINDNGGTNVVSDFSLHVKKTLPNSEEAIGVSSGATTTVSLGTWDVGEAQKSGYTATFGGDCNPSGQVTLVSDETKTCIITNNDVAQSAPACSDGTDNDSDGLIDGADPGCSGSSDTDETNGSGGGVGESPPSSGGGGGGGGGGGQGGGGLSAGVALFTSTTTGTGVVLGFSTTTESCDRYLTAFFRAGKENDLDQVKRLQRFLHDYEGANVAETGIYDESTLAAVHAFQTKYAADILAPWGISKSTGFVYLTTRKKVNEIFCRNTKTFFLTVDELKNIAETRSAAQVSGAPSPAPAGQSVSGESTVSQPKVPPVQSATSTQPASAVAEGVRGRLNNVFNFFRGIFNRTR